MIYEWQVPIWRQLTTELARLPHALLFSGPTGCGKTRFTDAFAARLLCEQATKDEFACGRCEGCTWFATGNHPDFRLIVPEAEQEPQRDEANDDEASPGPAQGKQRKPSKQILIEQVRALVEFVNIGAHRQGRRVIVVRPAEAMTAATANSLLKILEEPNASTFFIMTSSSPARLLATIRSRCRQLSFVKPSHEQSAQWLSAQGLHAPELSLAFCSGMPVAAVEFARSELAELWRQFLGDILAAKDSEPLRVASRWEGWLRGGKDSDRSLEVVDLVTWLQKWVFDLALLKMTGRVQYHPGMEERLQLAGKDAAISTLFACYNDLTRARAVAQHPLNPRLFIDDLILRYVRTICR